MSGKWQVVQPAHTAAGGAGAGVQAVSASNASFDGTVVITGGANITVSTAAGSKIVIDGGAGGAGGSFSAGVSNIGNTSGNTKTVSNQLVLAGGNNVTLSQATDANGATITISGVNTSAQQTGISGVIASDATYTSGTVQISGENNITVHSGAGQKILLSGPNTSAQQTGISGISASDTVYTSGTVKLTGVGGGVTVSSNTGQRIDISVAAPVAQTAQTGISGVSASDTVYTSGTVKFTGVGGGITVSSNTGQRIDLSVAAPVAQTGTQFSAGISGGNTSGDTGTVAGRVVFAGGNNITLSGSTNGVSETITISGAAAGGAQTAISGIVGSDATYTSGTVTFTGVGGGVTVKSNTGQRIDISVPAQSAETAISGVVASDSTYTSGTVIISGENNITVHSSTAAAGVQKVLISGPNTSAQQTGISSIAASNTTYTSGSVQFTGSNMITVKSSANQRVVIDATQTVQTQNLVDVTLSGNSTSGGAGYALVSSGTLSLAGGPNITLSQDGNKISISGGAGGAGGTFSAGVSNLGNTAGNTGTRSDQVVFVGTNPISLSQTTGAGGATVSIDGPATTSLSASTNITLSVTDSTIKFSVANPPKVHHWENMPEAEAGLMTHISAISKVPFYWPEWVPGGMTLNSVMLAMSNVATGTLQSIDIHFGVYTFANSTSAALLASASNNFVVSTASSASFSGPRNFVLTSPSTVAGISNLTPGNYLFGMMFSATATGAMHQSLYGASGSGGLNGQLGAIFPGNNQLSTATSQGPSALYGRSSATANVLPANVVGSAVINQGTGASMVLKPYIYIRS